jgi:hypothetical protein
MSRHFSGVFPSLKALTLTLVPTHDAASGAARP